MQFNLHGQADLQRTSNTTEMPSLRLSSCRKNCQLAPAAVGQSSLSSTLSSYVKQVPLPKTSNMKTQIVDNSIN